MLTVKKIDIIVNELLEGKRSDIVVRNLTKILYLFAGLGIGSVKRNHDSAIVDPVEVVGVVIALVLDLELHAHYLGLGEAELLLLLGQSIEISGKNEELVHGVEVRRAVVILASGIGGLASAAESLLIE